MKFDECFMITGVNRDKHFFYLYIFESYVFVNKHTKYIVYLFGNISIYLKSKCIIFVYKDKPALDIAVSVF